MAQTRTYENLKSELEDTLSDADYSSNYSSEILRATNRALDDINAGVVSKEKFIEVGFPFQKETEDINFVEEITGTADAGGSGTLLIDSASTFVTEGVAVGDIVENSTDGSFARVESVDSETQLTTSPLANGTDNTFSSGDSFKIDGVGYPVSTSWNMKFPWRIRLAEDENVEFEYVEPQYFGHKRNVGASAERMFTIDWDGNSQVFKINYDTTEMLYFDFFSNNLVKTSGGVRSSHVANDSDIFLIYDRFFPTLVDLTTAHLKGQIKGYDDKETMSYLSDARSRIMQMINSIGVKKPKPIHRMRVRSEWMSSNKVREENE